MPIYTGKSADGSDMKEFEGVYLSPDGKEWSTIPYTRKEIRKDKNKEWKQRISHFAKS